MNSIRSPARTYYAFCAKETAGRIKRKEAERKQLIEADKVTIFCLTLLLRGGAHCAPPVVFRILS